MRTRIAATVACLATMGLSWASHASADAASPAPAAAEESTGLQEIIVTAQKRGENIQKVPIAMVAYSGADLEKQGITNTQQLEQVTPGLVFSTYNQGAQAYIRGIGTDQNTTNSESAIGLYIDGVYLSNVYAIIQDFSDIERVEVLKGPQGTLYGRNTTGGAINIITREPQQEFHVDTSVDLGSYNTVRAKAFVTGGNEEVQGSLALTRDSHKGYQYDIYNGMLLDDENLTAARGKVKMKFGDNWSATIAANVMSNHGSNGCCFGNISANSLPVFLGGVVSDRPENVANNFGFQTNADGRGGSLHVRGDYPEFTFVSITAYDDFRRYGAVDVDASNLAIANSSSLPQLHTTYSQEFQVLSPEGSKINWIVGAFGYQETAAFDPLVGGNGSLASTTYTFGSDKQEAEAIFGQATFPITDQFSVTAGVRYNSDLKILTRESVIIPLTDAETDYPLSSKRWNKFLPKLTLTYDTGNNMFYATASKGFRSGAYNLTAPGTAPVNPENITAFEIGGKHTLPGGWARVNWSAFHYDYKDLQVSIVTEQATDELENAAEEKSYGADLSIEASPFQGFDASLGLAYLHAKYTSFPDASVEVPNGHGNNNVLMDVSGFTAVRSPTLSGFLNLSYTQETAVGTMVFSGNYHATEHYFFDANNRVAQPGYGYANLRAELTFPHTAFTVGFFADNVADKRAFTGVVETPISDIAEFTPPRIVGIHFRWQY